MEQGRPMDNRGGSVKTIIRVWKKDRLFDGAPDCHSPEEVKLWLGRLNKDYCGGLLLERWLVIGKKIYIDLQVEV